MTPEGNMPPDDYGDDLYIVTGYELRQLLSDGPHTRQWIGGYLRAYQAERRMKINITHDSKDSS